MKNRIFCTLISVSLFFQYGFTQSPDKIIQKKKANKVQAESPTSETFSGSPKVDCLNCPMYDLVITPFATFQTLTSSIVSDGCKIYQLTVSSGSQYTFKTGCGDGATATFDTYLELLDYNCSLITYNDDGCESARSIITWTATYSGLVYLKVRGYNSSHFGSFTLAWKSDPWCLTCPSYDYSITPTMAYQLHGSSISSLGCRIYYLNVTSGSQYTFKTGCGDGASSEFDTYLELYNSSCSLVASDDDGCEANRSIINWTANYTGAAYLKVKGYNYTAFGNYTLAFRGINPALCKTCPSFDFSIYPLAYFQTQSSSILSDGCKIYQVSVTSGRQYTFKTGCGDGATAAFDTFLELFDIGCNTITYNDDGCESARSIITWTSNYTGIAYLKVRGYNIGAYGTYTLAYYEIQLPNIWMGTFNYQWDHPGNWSLGHVPLPDEDVYLSSAGYQPCILSIPNQQCLYLEIQAGGTLLLSGGQLDVGESINIYGNLTLQNAGILTIGLDWYRSGTFNPGDGTVVFAGTSSSVISTNENFNSIHVNKQFENNCLEVYGANVSCQQYRWINGGIKVRQNGIFTVQDLFNNGLFGSWTIDNTGGTINLSNYGGWIDLNGKISLSGGTMNVYGGSTYSYWPFVGNAEINMTNGVLDFKDQGIIINNDAVGYTLTENITGGTIRTSQGFIGNRPEFTPTGGTFEFYGTSDYLISQSNGCTLHHVTIDKSAKEGEKMYPAGPLTDERSGMKISDGGKSNSITLDSDFTITGDLLIDWNSTLNLGGYNCTVSGGVSVEGILSMPNNTDLSANSIYWDDGSQANIIAGEIHVYNWIFGGGSMANIGADNTAYVDGWISVDYCISAFGSLVLEATSEQKDNGGKAPTIMINGDLTISTGANWMFLQSAEVQGDFYSQPGSNLVFDPKNLSAVGSASIAGYVGFMNGGAFTIEGDLNLISTGSLEMDEGIFTCLHPGAATLDGALIMNSPSLVSFPERSVTIGPNFNDNGINGGTFRFGESLYAPTAGNFQVNLANTEFISTSSTTEEIGLGTNNWLGNVLIQRSYYIELTSDLVIKGNLDITDNMLQATGEDLTVEGTIWIPHGILSLTQGSELIIGNSITIGTDGLFESYGSSGNFNRVFGGSFGSYGFIVGSGGDIRGKYTTFEDLDEHGIWIQSGAEFDPTSPLDYCTFKNGAAGGGLLTIDNNQDLTILSPNFPVGTPGGGHNVIKLSSSGTINMNAATGAMAGPAFEWDSYNLVNWTGGMAGLWTGNMSSDWFNISNWSNFSVPDANASVLIPAGCPFNPVVDGGMWAYCYNLTVDPGTDLTIANGKITASSNVYIYGNLTMTHPSGELQGEDFFFYAGSSDNITSGSIRCNNFEFSENTQVKLGGSNTVYCDWLYSYESAAEFANLHIVSNTKSANKPSAKWPNIPIKITGDFVVEAYYDPQYHIYVGGNTSIQGMLGDFSTLTDYDLTCQGNMDISGSVYMGNGSEFLVHGNLTFTGNLYIDTDCEFTCDYDAPEGWILLNGNLHLLPHSEFNITGANVHIGPSFSFTDYPPGAGYYYSGMVFGRTLWAPDPNFQLDNTFVSFLGGNTGHYILLNPSNHMLDFGVNKYPNGDFHLQSDITVTRNISIDDGTFFSAYDKTIYVGGDWYENYYFGGGGFEPMTGRVVFNGNADQTIWGAADFNILEVNKSAGQIVIPSGSISVCNSYDYNAGGIRVDGGTFTALDLYDESFDGINQLISGTLNINQDASQYLNLLGILDISGGVMNVTCATGDFSLGFFGDCHVAMSGGEMIVNTPEGFAVGIDNFGVFTENITGGTIKVWNELEVMNPSFTPTGGTIELKGPESEHVFMHAGANLYNLLINKTGSKDGENLQEYDQKELKSDNGKANDCFLLSNINIAGTLTVAKGTMHLNGFEARVYGDAFISTGGTLEVDGNANLLMAANHTLAVIEGGKLNVIGSVGNEARISRISTGNYTFNIDPGGTIGAQYGIFEYMGTNGIYIKSGSFIDPLYPFNNCSFRNGISGGRLITIHNNQNFTVTNAVFPANTWGGSYNVYKNSMSGTLYFLSATGGFAGAAYEYDPNNLVNWTTLAQTFYLKTYLEGAFNPSSGTMRTDLNTILPLSQPYHPTLPFFGNPMPDWYYGGTESVGAIPNSSLVDWVVVQLREGTTSATATTILATQAAFINNTGNIVGLDGTSPLNFTISYSLNLYAVVWHRNHLGIISANPLVNVGGTYTYDFSSGSGQAYGGTSAQKQLATGIWGMMSGDGDGSGGVLNNDRDLVWDIQAGTTGYKTGDYNMNLQVNNPDKNDKWLPNLGKGSFIP